MDPNKSRIAAEPDIGGRFLMMPAAVVLDATLSDSAVRVYALLLNAKFDETVRVSHGTMAAHLQVGRDTIRRAIRELRDAGHIANSAKNTGRSNEYTLCKSAPPGKIAPGNNAPGPVQKCTPTPSKIAPHPRSSIPRSFLSRSTGLQKIKIPTTTEGIEGERGLALIGCVRAELGVDNAKARTEAEALVRQAGGSLDLAYACFKDAAHRRGVRNVMAYAMQSAGKGEFPRRLEEGAA